MASFAFDCPIALKGIIGKASILIGSRFHALVGALCQSVPVIATSWSHKYEALLTEYGVSEFLITPNSGRQELNSLIDRVADDKERSRIVQLLDQRALMFKEQAELTFSRRRIAVEVKKVLESAIANAENNHQLDVDKLFVFEASVGKGMVMKIIAKTFGRLEE